MKAFFNDKIAGNIAQNRKEDKFTNEYSVIDADLNVICTLRIYSTDSRNYACFWLFTDDYRSGGAFAGGYGYHRPSAAAEMAFSMAGIELSESIGGVGETAIKEALLAIAKRATGKRKFIVHHAHA